MRIQNVLLKLYYLILNFGDHFSPLYFSTAKTPGTA